MIITYYWPPSGGPGVQRVLKFAKYLPQFGWDPVILTVKDGEYPALDDALEKEVDKQLEVYRISSLEFFDLFRKLTGRKKNEKIETYELIKNKQKLSWKNRLAQWVRNNLMIPDARVGWYWWGFREATKIVKDTQPDLIFSSSPPHSLQLLAGKLAKKCDVKWVADFRDPWTKSFYDKGIKRWKIAESINLSLEKRAVQNADCVTSVSTGVLELLGSHEAKDSRVISNGYDEDDFLCKKSPGNTFKIVYTGHISSVQNPRLFFEAISKLEDTVQQELSIDFYGSVDPDVISAARENGIEGMMNFHDYIPHEKATIVMTNADVLLLLIPRVNAKGILTGKLFEYLATKNFILGFGDPQGAAAKVIKKCGAGVMIDYDSDPTSIINTQWQLWKKGEKKQVVDNEIEKYSRKNITRELANLFNELCS